MENYSDSSSSDEEVINLLGELEKPRVFKKKTNPFFRYSDTEFRERYRLNKNTVEVIIHMLHEELSRNTFRNHALSVSDQILLTLRFYATGSFQILVGDDHGVHKSTVCRIIQTVTRQIAALGRDFIKMPSNEFEISEVKNGFHQIRNFPNVIGCIDGTHVPITSPGGDNAETFRNRKGYFSINVQVVCDSKLKIMNLDARWPGSTHDSTMFNASLLCARLEARDFTRSYLLGDSAYACSEFLLTPLANPITPAENNYNSAHIQTRNCVERCFGVWKRRFGCLALGLRTKLETTLEIIVATAVLHNIAVSQNELYDFNDVVLNDDINDNLFIANQPGGNALRMALIENVFNN